jgi:ribosomal protein S18 acetylase RimI-like enzyme
MSKSIRPLTTSDFSAVLELYIRTFPEIDDKDFSYAWKTRHSSSAGFFSEDTLVGFGLVAQAPVDTDTNIHTKLWFLTIDAAHRGGGAGTHLLKAIMEECDELMLCPVNEAPIIEWYKRHGFVISKTMPFIHHDIPIHTMVWRRETSVVSTATNTPISRASYGSMDSIGAFSLDD